MATTATDPLLDPAAPKQKAPSTGAALGATPASGQARGSAPSQIDTGVSAPTQAAPQAPAAPAAAPQAAPATTPAPAPTDQAGVNQFQGWAQTTFGRQATPEELQRIASDPRVGYTGGPLTPQQMQAAQQVAQEIAQQQGWTPPAPPPPSTAEQANSRLSDLLNLSFTEVDPNSPAIQQQVDAFRSAQSRASDRARMALAQRNQATGLSQTSGGADAQLQGLFEEQGQNEGAFTANLIANELGQQRTALQNALALAIQAGQQDKARALQEELGKLDIQLRSYLGKGQLALGAQQLSQQDRQFLESLGFNYNQLQAQMNNQAIQTILGL